MPLIQCVPNFSEGRDPEVIRSIAGAIAAAPGVRLVDASGDPDHNRMVVTFVGERDAVVAAAVTGAGQAVSLIDLSRHTGEHPRIGAVDVIPFVPLGETPMAHCVDAAREAGARIASELLLPVYFYEEAALRIDRRALPTLRGSRFDLLSKEELVGDEAPDAGPTRLHPTAGAVAIGARGPLIAFNVNLVTDDVAIARSVAAKVRERDGGLVGVRALGMFMASRRLAQVSINVTRPHLVSLHQVLERVTAEASALGVQVAGTELIGTLRLDDLLQSVRHDLAMAGMDRGKIVDLPPEPLP